jgi:glycosyltransferase involved in cell wall biosynthesis
VTERVPSSALTIAAIVPLRNKQRFVGACLESIVRAAANHGRVDVIVVDNGSTDGSLDIVHRWEGPVRLLLVPDTTIAGVRNAGAIAASAPVLSFIDADCVVPPDYFRRMEAVLSSCPADATGFEVALPTDRSWVEATWGMLHAGGGDGPRHYLNSAAFAVRRTWFDAVGGFDARLTTGEDTDICLRLGAAGARIWADPGLQVVHLDNPRSLRAFFAKERWRGLGSLSRSILVHRPRATASVILFGVLGIIALAVVLRRPLHGVAWLLSVGLLLVVPAIAAVYRMWQAGQRTSLARATILYFVYYLARLTAVIQVALGSSR